MRLEQQLDNSSLARAANKQTPKLLFKAEVHIPT